MSDIAFVSRTTDSELIYPGSAISSYSCQGETSADFSDILVIPENADHHFLFDE